MGGVIYSFSKDFNPDKHDEIFQKGLKSCEYKFPNILSEYQNIGATNHVLEAEYYLVKNNTLKIFPIIESINRLNTEFKSVEIIIVSTSLEKTTKLICNRVGLEIKPKKIINMSNYGSKKDFKS